MTKAAWRMLIAVAATVNVGTAGVGTALGQPLTAAARSAARIRPTPALAPVIQEAVERSITFRQLVERINASDGIVYVEQGDCGLGVHACLARITAAKPNRFFRIKVDARKRGPDLMGSIGHELRHVIEVLDSGVTTMAEMFFFYLREGRRVAGWTFETEAAVRTGNAVRAEIRRSAALHTFDGVPGVVAAATHVATVAAP